MQGRQDTEEFRVVLVGSGPWEGTTVASSPTDRATAMAGRDLAAELFAQDVAAGRLSVHVLAEETRPGGTPR